MNHYEIIIIYEKDCGEILWFSTNEYMNDSNDIVSHAIKLGLMDEQHRDCVRSAKAISEYEINYVKQRYGRLKF